MEDMLHPMVEAYLAGRQHALERQRLLQEQTKATEDRAAEVKYRQDSLKQVADIAKANRDFEISKTEHEQTQRNLENKIRLMNMETAGEVKRVPEGPPDLAARAVGQPQQNSSAPGAMDISGVGSFLPTSPQERIQYLAQQARMLEEAKSQGGLGAQQTLEAQRIAGQKELQTSAQTATATEGQKSRDFEQEQNALNRTSQATLQGKALANATGIAQLNRASQERIEGARNATEQNKISAEYGTPESNLALGIDFATGAGKPTLSNPRHQNAVAGIEKAGLHSFDPKNIAELQALDKIEPTLQKMRDFAKLLPSEADEGPVQAKIHAMGQKAMVDSSIPYDLKVAQGQIMGQITDVDKALEGMPQGRVLSKQFDTGLGAYVGAGQTREQALSNVSSLQGLLNDAREKNFQGTDSAQRALIQQRWPGLIVPGATYNKMVSQKLPNGQNHKIGTNDGNQWFNIDTGKPDIPIAPGGVQ